MKQFRNYVLRLQYNLLFCIVSLCLLASSKAFGQREVLAFPQMPTVTQFYSTQTTQLTKKRRKYLSSLALTQHAVLVNGKAYTQFITARVADQANAEKLPFTLRLAGDSLLMPLTLYGYIPAAQKTHLLDSLGPKRLESTFFCFGAAVGTKWTCLTSYSGTGRWNTITTQLREIRRTAEGEVLYVIAFSEAYYGVSDYEFWREFVLSRERGLVQMSGEGMIGGEQVYVRESKSAK